MDHQLNTENTDVEMQLNEEETDQRERERCNISYLHQDDFHWIHMWNSSDQDGVSKTEKIKLKINSKMPRLVGRKKYGAINPAKDIKENAYR